MFMTNGLIVEQKSIVKVPNKKLPNRQNITLYKCIPFIFESFRDQRLCIVRLKKKKLLFLDMGNTK